MDKQIPGHTDVEVTGVFSLSSKLCGQKYVDTQSETTLGLI